MVQRMIPGMRRGRVRMFSRPTAAFVRATLAAACLVGLLALSLTRAGAQDGRGDARQACTADYQRLCAGVSPGGGRVQKSLKDKFDALSDARQPGVGPRTGQGGVQGRLPLT